MQPPLGGLDLANPSNDLADFDGDALNGLLILDNRMWRKLNRLAPHLTVLDTNKPRSFSRAMQMPEPIVTTQTAWMYEGADTLVKPELV